MISTLYHIFVYDPLYNALAFLIGVVPGHEVGIAVILLTLIVKVVILPFAHKSVASQHAMHKVAPKIDELKKKYENDKQEQAKRIMALYKEHGVNPFGSILLLLIQLPVIFTLYFIFLHDIGLEKHDILYSFVSLPESASMIFLGILDITQRSIPMGLLVGITQFFQMRLSVPPLPKKVDGAVLTMKDEFARSMNIQMRYIMPAFLAFIAMSIPSAVTLYWVTSNLFAIAHEFYVKRRAGLLLEPNTP